MDETRRARIESVVKEELSLMISRELKDPRIVPLTITSVRVSPDVKQAIIMVSLFGGDPTAAEYPDIMQKCLDGLHSAGGFMRRRLSKALQVRHTPELIFKEDKGLENSIRVFELLKQLEKEKNDKPTTSS